MKKSFQVAIGIMVVTSLLLSACALPASTRPGLTVNLLTPRSGMILPLGHHIEIIAQAVAPAGGITHMTFYVNGLVVGEDSTIETQEVVDTPSIYFQGQYDWTPTLAGEYLVQVEAFRSDGSAFTAANRVCVLEGLDPGNAVRFLLMYGYTGPCEILPPNPAAPPGLAVGLSANAIPASLAYNWMCPASVAAATIAFEATVDDPSDRVVFVSAEFTGDSTGTAAGDEVMLNWTASIPTGEKIFTGSTGDITSVLQEFEGDGGILTWWVNAYGRSGEVLAMDGPHDILAAPCTAPVIGAPMPIVIESTATLTPFPTETSTPTLVPVVPTKPKPGGGGGGGNSCSGLDEPKCNATAGCSWDKDKKSCS